MKIQLFSDVHNELHEDFLKIKSQPDVNTLILAGDIGVSKIKILLIFWIMYLKIGRMLFMLLVIMSFIIKLKQ